VFSLLSLILVLALSLLVTRVAAVALTFTGLSRATARFQARSAFTGAGFTTAESEKVVNHPVRRRIVQTLMLLGNAGIVTSVSALILTFLGQGEGGAGLKILLLVAGTGLLGVVATSQWVDRYISRATAWALHRFTDLDTRDYSGLLHLGGEYMVSELHVEPGDWLTCGPLRDLRLRDEGVLVLALERPDGTFVGVPDFSMRVRPGDNLILYGRATALQRLDERRTGWNEQSSREEGLREQQEVERQEQGAGSD